jgi:hypothetical protein
LVRYKDLTGKVISKWVIVSRYMGEKRKDNDNHVYWNCVCECGAKSIVSGSDLRRKRSLQCVSCADKERNLQHGDTREGPYKKLYKQWHAMRQRCKSDDPSYAPYYKAKGITYCEEWDDYLVFKEWALVNGWAPCLTLDRKDGNKNYSPENCRWATRIQQQRNRSCSKILEINGEKIQLMDAIEKYGNVTKAPAVLRRLEAGWDALTAVSTPKIIGRPKKKGQFPTP